MPVHESGKKAQHKCIGFSQALEEQRAKREERMGPQPWVGMKFAVGLVVAIASYTFYVYVARLCNPMIHRERKALGGRTLGIVLLVAFSLLFLMFGWAYAKVVFTPPGFAEDYVAKTPPPIPRPAPPPPLPPGPWESEESLRASAYNASARPSRTYSRPSVDIPSFAYERSPSRSPSHSRRNTHESTTISMTQARAMAPRQSGSTEVAPRVPAPAMVSPVGATGSSQGVKLPPSLHISHPGSGGSNSGLPPLLFSRRPPTHPVLAPEYRYCQREGFVKPVRAHHCRACGTCILKYDHHCPWIGQCVGAFNHKFFVNFLQWSSILTLFIFASLIVLVVKGATSGSQTAVDPQHLTIIALSGLFNLFTVTLLWSQVYLITINVTTVEHLGIERMRERERSVLAKMVRRPCSCSGEPDYGAASGLPTSRSPINVLVSRRRIVRQWDAEWGEIETEGNLWWLGSKRANWEATMGRSKLGWILPIGRSLGDGVTYPTNPRFDRDGRWRKRSQWPVNLR